MRLIGSSASVSDISEALDVRGETVADVAVGESDGGEDEEGFMKSAVLG